MIKKKFSIKKRPKMLSNLKRIRFLKGKTQDDLMIETGIDQGLISRFENNYKKPTQDQKKKLARALKASEKELFPEKN